MENPARIVITGASRGLGRALALDLAGPGRTLALVARGAEELAAVAAQVEARGGRALPLAADVADPAGPLAARILEGLGGAPELVVLGASTLGPVPLRPLLDLADEELDRVFTVNLAGPFRLARRLLPAMVLAGRGTLLAISSDAAVEAWAGWGPYGASKAALDHLARTWAVELAGTGVRVLSVDPGEMDTVMHAEAMPEADRALLQRPEEVARRLLDLVRAPAGEGVRRVLAAEGGAR